MPQASFLKGFLDIGGMGKEKERLREDIIDYIGNPELEELDKVEYGIQIARGFFVLRSARLR